MNSRKSNARRPINLALQGGGSHGAFTWGVMDCLFEDGRVELCAISGTSAGAMNAVVAADGLMRGGEQGAREALTGFWKKVSDSALKSPVQRSWLDVFMGNWSLDMSPGYAIIDFMSRLSSPYQLNPMNMNPLRDVLESVVDFDLVRSCDQMKVFVSATNVETGRVQVFDRRNLTSDMVMASACLPLMFQAVEIEGVPYWDGGFMGNPVLFPFHDVTESDDIVIVQINPIARAGVPKSAREILNRMNEITFNGSLLKELRAIDFVGRLIDEGKLDAADYRRAQVHIIENQDALLPLGSSSKMNAEWAFLTHLRDIGRRTAETWLNENFDALGERSTIDLREMFQGIGAVHHG